LSAPTDNQIEGFPANQFSPSPGTTLVKHALIENSPVFIAYFFHCSLTFVVIQDFNQCVSELSIAELAEPMPMTLLTPMMPMMT